MWFWRFKVRGRTGTDLMIVPFFDREGLQNALVEFIEDVTSAKDIASMEDLIEEIHSLYGTFFYPPSVVSMLLLDENKNPLKVYNADTSRHIKRYGVNVDRTMADWDIYNEKGLAYHVINHNPEYRIYIFPDSTGCYLNDFIRPQNNYYYNVLSQPTMEIRNNIREESFVKVSQIDDYRLLRKNFDGENFDTVICSAIIAPLVFDNELLGVIFIGIDIYHAFSFGDTVILKDQNIVDLQQFISTVSTAVKAIREIQKTIEGRIVL